MEHYDCFLWWRDVLSVMVRMRESMNCQVRAGEHLDRCQIGKSVDRSVDSVIEVAAVSRTMVLERFNIKTGSGSEVGTRVGNDRPVVEWQCAYADDPVCRSLTFCL
jgi:hypothetical protein